MNFRIILNHLCILHCTSMAKVQNSTYTAVTEYTWFNIRDKLCNNPLFTTASTQALKNSIKLGKLYPIQSSEIF